LFEEFTIGASALEEDRTTLLVVVIGTNEHGGASSTFSIGA
jgi:hypothetical protein